jgi:hypothetical protein
MQINVKLEELMDLDAKEAEYKSSISYLKEFVALLENELEKGNSVQINYNGKPLKTYLPK